MRSKTNTPKTAGKRSGNPVYNYISDRILELLDEGVVPWRIPWTGTLGGPLNMISNKPYRGINSLLTQCYMMKNNWESPYFMTFNQIKKLGGSVKPGQKSIMIIYWQFNEYSKTVTVKDSKPDPDTGKTGTHEELRTGKRPLLRYYNVFNLEQTKGIPENKIRKIEKPGEGAERIAAAEEIAAGYLNSGSGPQIAYTDTGRACYAPALDVINTPKIDYFKNTGEYYSTVFHEMGHSTGHETRLEREGITNINFFGSHEYSKEELIAEGTAALLCGVAGIDNQTIENSTAYIGHWRAKISEDNTLIVSAMGAAQKAADYILGEQPADGREKK